MRPTAVKQNSGDGPVYFGEAALAGIVIFLAVVDVVVDVVAVGCAVVRADDVEVRGAGADVDPVVAVGVRWYTMVRVDALPDPPHAVSPTAAATIAISNPSLTTLR